MMGWEEPLMIAHTKYAREKLQDKIARGEEISVLNIGFGLGIVSAQRLSLFIALNFMMHPH